MAKMLQQPDDLLDEEQMDEEDIPDESDNSSDDENIDLAPAAAVPAKVPGAIPVIPGKNGDIPVGLHPKNQSRDELKQKLYQDLLKRADPNSDESKKQYEIKKDLRQQQGTNDVIAALNKSAAMAGSVGGKYADTSSVDQAAKSMNKEAGESVADISQQASQKDKLQQYLLGQMNSQDINQAKLANQSQMLDKKIAGGKEIAGVKASSAKDMLDQRLKAMANVKSQGSEAMASKQDNSDAQKLAGALKGSSRDQIGSNAAKVNAADRINALIDSAPGGNLDQRQMRELATSLASLLANGAATQTQIDELVPRTAQGNADKLYEYFSGVPQGVNQQAFVARIRDTIEREKEVASEQLKQARAGVLSGYSRLRKSNPEAWNDIASQNGFVPQTDFDDKGHYQAKTKKSPQAEPGFQGVSTATAAPGGGKMDAKIQEYAQAHKIDYGTASNILKNRGYKANE